MTRRVFGAGVVAAALAGVATACGSGSDPAPSSPGRQLLKVTLTDQGCSPKKLTARSGPMTFVVSNGGTKRSTELEVLKANGVVLGEKENVVGNLTGAFTLRLGPGHYILACPLPEGGGNGTLVVTGKAIAVRATPGTKLAAAVAAYQAYVRRQVARLRRGTERFAAALEAGKLAQAKALYGPVRRYYERIEPVAESFGALDPRLDARVNDVVAGTPWTGFHHLEQILWVQGKTAGTGVLAKQLNADVATLQRKVATLTYQPAQLANGSVELLDEVANSKISGEEDRYSHTDLSDFQGNLEGSRKAFDLLRPALAARGDGALADTIAQRFDAVQRRLDRYRRSTPLGFALYSAVTAADRRAFAQEIDALAEPLSTVAAKVSG